MIVPSSNTTMETEIPELLQRAGRGTHRFTFHSSRMRMKKVNLSELGKMNAQADRCAEELSDAAVDVAAYACLVAVMSEGPQCAQEMARSLSEVLQEGNPQAQMITSAGALIEGVRRLGVSKVALVTPYMKPLTAMVVDCLESAGIQVVDAISLEISDNLAVGRRDPEELVSIARDLDLKDAEAVIVSACVQMPSLEAIPQVEAETGLPVLSAATATLRSILDTLDLSLNIPGGGQLLQMNSRSDKEESRS
ncbi:MAG: aspartate/glutamate racemase family protein [Planctomycetes bacterium]|nr:aspartate/glutamate racemase family protein [Planctomycetota bacterium]